MKVFGWIKVPAKTTQNGEQFKTEYMHDMVHVGMYTPEHLYTHMHMSTQRNRENSTSILKSTVNLGRNWDEI